MNGFNNSSDSFNKRFLVIVTDRQKGRYFTIFMDSLEKLGNEIRHEDVFEKVRAEKTRMGKSARHIQDHVQHHLKNVGEEVMNFLIKNRINQLDGVIVGGHRELIHKTEHYLPSKLRRKVVGEFVTDVHSPVGELAELAKRAVS